MSHIDKALRAWESANTGEAGAAASAPDQVSPLQQYAPESRSASRVQPHLPALSTVVPAVTAFAPVQAPVAVSERTAAPRPRLSPSPDLQGRLVSSTAGSISLEQYRRLAAVLHDEQLQRQIKTVLVTSALPREGKTLTVVNLALTLSDSYGRRVLLVDGDLRAPSLHTVLNIPNTVGLSEALLDDLHDAQHYVEVTDRLTVLTAGTPGRTPLAGLTSNRMKELLDDWASRFDWVLIDTSPVGVLPDAQLLARLVGAVVFVIGAGSTPALAVERAIAELGGPDAIIGTVLNRMEERRIPAADYYGHYTMNEGLR
jgi:capsular exopolysaccharide synthesis family protein